MPEKKFIVFIGPEEIGSVLTMEERLALHNIIDKLLLKGIHLDISYHEINPGWDDSLKQQ